MGRQRQLRNLVHGIYPRCWPTAAWASRSGRWALGTALHTETDIVLPGRLDAPVESACCFTVAEALTSAVKRSG